MPALLYTGSPVNSTLYILYQHSIMHYSSNIHVSKACKFNQGACGLDFRNLPQPPVVLTCDIIYSALDRQCPLKFLVVLHFDTPTQCTRILLPYLNNSYNKLSMENLLWSHFPYVQQTKSISSEQMCMAQTSKVDNHPFWADVVFFW